MERHGPSALLRQHTQLLCTENDCVDVVTATHPSPCLDVSGKEAMASPAPPFTQRQTACKEKEKKSEGGNLPLTTAAPTLIAFATCCGRDRPPTDTHPTLLFGPITLFATIHTYIPLHTFPRPCQAATLSKMRATTTTTSLPRTNMALSVSFLLVVVSSCCLLVNGFSPASTRKTLAAHRRTFSKPTTQRILAPLQSVSCKEDLIPTVPSFATSPSLVLLDNDENTYANDTSPASPLSPSDLQQIVQDTTTSSNSNTNLVVDSSSPLESLVWRGAVVGLCAVWASNFPATKLILAEPGIDGDSMLFAVARFSTATLALLPFAIQQLRAADPAILRGSAVCGAWVAFGTS